MPNVSGFVLQDRDLTLMRGLFESRLMTADHVSDLYFDGKREATKKRLQRLKAANVIAERPRRRYEPAILFLTTKGLRLLSDRGGMQGFPRVAKTTLEKRARVSDSTLRHELEVMEVKAAMVKAIKTLPAFSVVEFSTWPLLFQFQARRTNHDPMIHRARDVMVKPDGHIRLHERGDEVLSEHNFFLEVDRSSEVHEILGQRAATYLDYYQSGGFSTRQGQPRSARERFPFRVLMVFKNNERRNNAAERISQIVPQIKTLIWLTTFAEITTDPLKPIWLCPIDYRKSTVGTPFDPEYRRGINIYRRQPERERLVEQKTRMRRLFQLGMAEQQ